MSDLLIVRHGEGLGRLDHYMGHVLAGIRVRHPDLWPRVRVHDTGSAAPSLDRIGAVFFALGDPLERLHPDCFEEAVTIAEAARAAGARILQEPTVLSAHGRGRTAERLEAAGIRTPVVHSYENLDELEDLLGELELPVLLRAEFEHAQSGTLAVCSDEEALAAVQGDAPVPGAVSRLVDTRHRRRSTPGPDPFLRWHHRYRAFVFGGRAVGGQLYFASSPIVSYGSSVWGRMEDRSLRLRETLGSGHLNGLAQRVVRLDPWYRRALHEDLAARDRPLPDPRLFERAAAALELDFVAFDYSRLPDGEAIIWEANPYPYFEGPNEGRMTRERQLTGHLLDVQEAIISFFRRSLGDPVPDSSS